MKQFTIGDGDAIMILAAQRMGRNPLHVDDAKRQLEGGAIHPITAKAINTEAANSNNSLRHDATLIAQANIHAEHLKCEYGFSVDLSKEAFLALQEEAEGLEMAHAKGQDQPEHTARRQLIDKLMDAAS